jgi:hypothetical protein
MKEFATRQYTNELVGLAEEGVITWESLAHACLGYMSEADVRDMAQAEFDVWCGDADDVVEED